MLANLRGAKWLGGSSIMQVSVIIPVYNDTESLVRCLACLREQTARAAEIIVVDDGSSTPVKPLLRDDFPEVRWMRNDNSAGPGLARNRAIDAAHGEALAFTDSDCHPASHWIAVIGRELARHDVVTGPLLHEPSPLGWATAIGSFGAFQERTSGQRCSFISSNFAVRADRLQGARFDPRLPFAAEDLVLSETLHQRNVGIHYAGDLIVHHRPKLSLRDVLRRAAAYGRGYLPSRRLMPTLPGAGLARFGKLSALPLSLYRLGLDAERLGTLGGAINMPLRAVPTVSLLLVAIRCAYAYGILTTPRPRIAPPESV